MIRMPPTPTTVALPPNTRPATPPPTWTPLRVPPWPTAPLWSPRLPPFVLSTLVPISAWRPIVLHSLRAATPASAIPSTSKASTSTFMAMVSLNYISLIKMAIPAGFAFVPRTPPACPNAEPPASFPRSIFGNGITSASITLLSDNRQPVTLMATSSSSCTTTCLICRPLTVSSLPSLLTKVLAPCLLTPLCGTNALVILAETP
mmetsp:Transcript_13041/g.23235  ORF Transcript_13041/g.23235 Transcript_13041/m.23235 type:complete len:204 (+) Transcript_13041:814-1425(+)